jgi:uncharacterized protein involved in exopolysaccharide biosynthesis
LNAAMLKSLSTFVLVLLLAGASHAGGTQYVSTARLLVGGADVNPGLENGEAFPESFFATNIELLEASTELKERAWSRFDALKREPVKAGNPFTFQTFKPIGPRPEFEIKVTRKKGSRILTLTAIANDPQFAKGILDCLITEFLAFRKEHRFRGFQDQAVALEDNLVALEKDMQRTEQKIKDMEQEKSGATDLAKAKDSMKELKKLYAEGQQKYRQLDEKRTSMPEVFSVLEQATPGLAVTPNLLEKLLGK